MQWAFVTANYVGRALGYTQYADVSNWGVNHRATVEQFHGPQFAERFEDLVAGIKAGGFDAIELWVAHLEPLIATPEMVETAVAILARHQLPVISYTAGFGQPGVARADAVRIFETAQRLGARVLAQGFHPANGALVSELGAQYGIRMGLENHPQKNAQEVIDIVAPFAPWVGAAIDTGWFGTQGYDAARAVRELRDHLVHVHLKDVAAAGGHHTCVLGEGVVDIRGVLRELKQIGYAGPISIEHEPYNYDPMPECMENLQRAKAWWAES
jgi:L-ribulose-5-phosphate 3-epimerase